MMEENVLHTYKGVNKDMTAYGGFKYEVGKEYEVEGEIKTCDNGFHACEMPLNVFDYFPPATSRYFEAEQSGDISRDGDDTKIASRKIKLGAEIGIPGLVKAQIEYVKAHTTMKHTDPKQATAGNYGVSTAGYSGVSTAGNYGVSTAGDRGVSTAGDRGVSTAGDRGVSTAGNYGVSTAGDRGVSASLGSSKIGRNGIAVARNSEGEVKVSGGLGAVIVAVVENETDCNIKEWKAAVVDGETIKPDTWYSLIDGEFVEVEP